MRTTVTVGRDEAQQASLQRKGTVRRVRRRVYSIRESRGRAAAFLLPGLFFYVGFLIIPLVATVVLSFTSWDGFSYTDIHFNGTDNYVGLTQDPVFWQALWHNAAFLASSVLLKAAFALALALCLRRAFPGSVLFQGIFVVPSTLSLVVLGILVKFFLDPNNGLVNPLLQAVGLGHFAGAWLGDPHRALPVMILLDVWIGFGLPLFVFLSSMASLPDDVFEAAKVDGAAPWQEVLYVLLPMLAPAVRLVILLAAIESLKVFATVYVATGGGPDHATEVLSTWAYFQAFTGNRVGYGSAVMTVLLIFTLILAIFYVRANTREER